MIASDGMSPGLGLLYAYDYVHYKFIFLSLYSLSFLQTLIEYQLFLSNNNNSQTVLFLPIDGILSITSQPGQSEPDINGNEEYTTLLRSPELKPHHQMQYGIILRILFFLEAVLPFSMG